MLLHSSCQNRSRAKIFVTCWFYWAFGEKFLWRIGIKIACGCFCPPNPTNLSRQIRQIGKTSIISNIYSSTFLSSGLAKIVEQLDKIVQWLSSIQNLTDGHKAACTAHNRSLPSACSIVWWRERIDCSLNLLDGCPIFERIGWRRKIFARCDGGRGGARAMRRLTVA